MRTSKRLEAPAYYGADANDPAADDSEEKALRGGIHKLDAAGLNLLGSDVFAAWLFVVAGSALLYFFLLDGAIGGSVLGFLILALGLFTLWLSRRESVGSTQAFIGHIPRWTVKALSWLAIVGIYFGTCVASS